MSEENKKVEELLSEAKEVAAKLENLSRDFDAARERGASDHELALIAAQGDAMVRYKAMLELRAAFVNLPPAEAGNDDSDLENEPLGERSCSVDGEECTSCQ